MPRTRRREAPVRVPELIGVEREKRFELSALCLGSTPWGGAEVRLRAGLRGLSQTLRVQGSM